MTFSVNNVIINYQDKIINNITVGGKFMKFKNDERMNYLTEEIFDEGIAAKVFVNNAISEEYKFYDVEVYSLENNGWQPVIFKGKLIETIGLNKEGVQRLSSILHQGRFKMSLMGAVFIN